MSEQPASAEKDAGRIRAALREHAPLPGLALFCGCGHQATTPYNRETHLVDVLMAPQTSDPDVAPADVVPAASVSGSASEDTTPSGSEPDTRPLPPAECDGCLCPTEHDGDYGSSGHAGPCPPHTCDLPPGE